MNPTDHLDAATSHLAEAINALDAMREDAPEQTARMLTGIIDAIEREQRTLLAMQFAEPQP